MKAIILSAGQGSRLGHLTDDRPKCLIDFAGRSLLDRQLDTLAACGVDEVVVVTGFRDDQIEASLARRSGGPRVRTIFNPFYKVADNLGSLFVAREELAIDRKDRYDEDDMKVVADDDGRLRAIGKRIAKSVNAESIGLLAFRGDGAARFRRAIEKAMRTSEGTTIWYLRVIHHLAQNGEVWTYDIAGEEWGEVDFPEDVASAEALCAGWDAARESGAEKAAAA